MKLDDGLYRASLDIALDHLASGRVYTNRSAAVDGAVGYDGLAENASEWRRGILCEDDLLWRHLGS